MNVIIIDYGAGNIASVQHALKRIGHRSELSSDPEVITSADKVIFPGVGQASSAMAKLRECGLDKVIPSLNQPVLGICLGMQLLCDYSEEAETHCLGIIPSIVKKFMPLQREDRIPHMGWAPLIDISMNKKNIIPIMPKNHVYFVHGYYVPINSFTTSTSKYLIGFSASVKKDNFHGVQFHPEKSGSYGEALLKNFIDL